MAPMPIPDGELMDFILIPPDELRAVWSQVSEGLADMPADDWIPEDVYHLIKAGDSALYMALRDGTYDGFLVVRQLVAEFSRTPTLHVWLAYHVTTDDVREHVDGFLRQLAQNMGARRITFGSPRMGWAKRYPLQTATYEIPMEAPQ